MISSIPAATHSSTMSWMLGTSTSGSISLGIAFVAGRNRVPSPATGSTALRTFVLSFIARPILSPLPARATGNGGRRLRRPGRRWFGHPVHDAQDLGHRFVEGGRDLFPLRQPAQR